MDYSYRQGAYFPKKHVLRILYKTINEQYETALRQKEDFNIVNTCMNKTIGILEFTIKSEIIDEDKAVELKQPLYDLWLPMYKEKNREKNKNNV